MNGCALDPAETERLRARTSSIYTPIKEAVKELHRRRTKFARGGGTSQDTTGCRPVFRKIE
jgi:hypothetical protein